MKIYILILSVLLLCNIQSSAQTGWQWGKRGGSPAGSGEGEVEMVTDAKGNIYVLAKVSQGSRADIDGYESPDNNNQLSLTKWSCDGTRKWTKYFGGTASIKTRSSALGIDSLGGLYFTGTMALPSGTQVYFDTDTILSYTPKQWYIVKYDTAGNFKWLNLPQADSVTLSEAGTANKSGPFGLDVAPNGDIYILSYLANGIFSNSYVNTTEGFKMMRYNKNGTLMNVKPLQITVSSDINGPQLAVLASPHLGFARDHNSGRFYLQNTINADYGTLTFGTTTVNAISSLTSPLYVAGFDSTGTNIWVRQTPATALVNSQYSRPRLDEAGNIYICGGASQGSTFAGHTFTNTYSTLGLAIFVLSLDKNGNIRWAKNAGSSVTDLKGITYTKGIVSVSDGYDQFLSWGADTVMPLPALSACIQLSRFNANTGMPVTRIDTFSITGVAPGTTDLVGDGKGNIYLGGRLPLKAFLPTVTLTSIGGTFDFFVAKYGSADCNCTVATPSFSSISGTGNLMNFTYTGSTPIDSVRWEFGDGSMASGLTTSHTYASNDTFSVSIVVYNNCGIVAYAKDVVAGAPNSIAGNDPATAVGIYPNPAKQSIMIEGAGIGSSVELYNMVGKQVLATTITQEKQTVDVSSLAKGMYIIHFTTKEGKKGSVKMVKD